MVKTNKIHKINLQEENDVLQGRKRFCTTSALANLFKRGVSIMAKNTVPEAKDALNRFKMEAASEVGVNLKQGYNGDLTSKQAGSVGGQMVNVMCPIRTVTYNRNIRTINGHNLPLVYEFCLAV